MSKYTDEDRARIFAEAHAAISAAEATLAEPRPQLAEPPPEDKLAKWRRQAREQEERFARERAESQPTLTEWEVAQLERDKLSGMLAEQKDFVLAVLAHALAGMRDELIEHLEAKLERLEAQLRADNKSGEIIDLPNPFRKRA